jgi:hypothetical protein
MEKLFERRFKMKKLLALVLVAVFAAAMCATSYGSILVYKTTQTSTVLDITGSASITKVAEKGFLVIDVDLTTQTVTSAQQITFTGRGGATLRSLIADVVFYDNVTGNLVVDYSSGNTNAVLFGKTSDGKAAGLTGSQVAKTLKGNTLDFVSPFFSSGAITATLDAKTTKDSQATTIDALVPEIIAEQTKFTLVPDSTPPTPSPMTFVLGGEPNAISDTQIRMTATTATDALTPPVEYYFTNKTATGHDSGWQSSPTYADSGLASNTLYTYTVMARDSVAPVPNVTAASADMNATTHAVADSTPPDPNPPGFAVAPAAVIGSDTSIAMTATTETDAQGVEYYFTNKTVGGHNSGWQASSSFTDVGLTPDTNYGYTVKARDRALVPNYTAESNQMHAVTSKDTAAPDPNPATFAIDPHAASPTSISFQVRIATDSTPTVMYQYRRTNPDFTVTMSSWQADSNFTDTGLTEKTTYTYQVRSKDGVTPTPNIGDFSAGKSATTLTTLTTQMNTVIFATDRTATTPTFQPVTVSIAAGTYDEDVDVNEPNITLQSADGAATIQLQAANMGVDLSQGCVLGGSAGHGFTILGGSNGHMIDTANDVTVSYCDINTVGSVTAGVRVARGDRITIQNNNFVTHGTDVAIDLGGGVGGLIKNLAISNNTCATTGGVFVDFASTDCCGVTVSTNVTSSGINIGVGNTLTKIKNVTISGNTFNSTSGIQVYEATASAEPNRLMALAITGNTFAAGSNAYALLIPSAPSTGSALEPNDVNWATFTFTNNVILRTPGGATKTVDNQVGAAAAGLNVASILNAQHNYWDDPSGPTGGCTGAIGASISNSAYVTYQPFWTTATGTDANCPI